jgi:hypothetical protein
MSRSSIVYRGFGIMAVIFLLYREVNVLKKAALDRTTCRDRSLEHNFQPGLIPLARYLSSQNVSVVYGLVETADTERDQRLAEMLYPIAYYVRPAHSLKDGNWVVTTTTGSASAHIQVIADFTGILVGQTCKIEGAP